jgi:hypothetical protein
MSTPLTPEPTTEATPPPGPGTKTLSVKNIPHAVWQRARQNALASNLSFGDYVVKLLGTAGPFVPPAQSGWEALTGSCAADATSQPPDGRSPP